MSNITTVELLYGFAAVFVGFLFIFSLFYLIINTSIIPADKIWVLVVVTLLLSGTLSMLLLRRRKISIGEKREHTHK